MREAADEIDLWRDRCQKFAGKQELVDRINELLAEQDQLRDALEHVRRVAIQWAPDARALRRIDDISSDALGDEG